jgi:hypothetical protein
MGTIAALGEVGFGYEIHFDYLKSVTGAGRGDRLGEDIEKGPPPVKGGPNAAVTTNYFFVLECGTTMFPPEITVGMA